MELLVRVNSHGGMASRVWCFTVEWLNRVDQRFRHRHTSLNLFEHDLQDFEIYTGPIELVQIHEASRVYRQFSLGTKGRWLALRTLRRLASTLA